MSMKIQFLGAARQVTGSCHFLQAGGLRILVDCGLFQERSHRSRNWDPFPIDPASIDYLLLTHAHLDHCGRIPKLVREGLRCPILTTSPSQALVEIILEDAGEIQEEDARYKRKRHRKEGRTPPRPVEPLYTSKDVKAVLPLIRAVAYGEPVALNEEVSVIYREAGHILGSAMLEVRVIDNVASDPPVGRPRERTVVFSGDIGQWDQPIIHDPTLIEKADYVVMESTYGNRNHPDNAGVPEQLEKVINAAVEAGGNIVIPTFAVERAQDLLYHLGQLTREKRIPPLLIFLDSPMAVDVTEVFREHGSSMDEDAQAVIDSGGKLFKWPGVQLVRPTSESKAINRIKGSCIILAGSGMCTAGRIKHHLINNISRPQSTILFVGYQPPGTLGHEIVKGSKSVRIHGKSREVRARIEQISGCSAHADQSDLLRWIAGFQSPIRRVFLVHDEEEAALALSRRIGDNHGYSVEVPEYQSAWTLD